MTGNWSRIPKGEFGSRQARSAGHGLLVVAKGAGAPCIPGYRAA